MSTPTSSYAELLQDGHSIIVKNFKFPSSEDPDHDLLLAMAAQEMGTIIPQETHTYILSMGWSFEVDGLTIPHRDHPDHDILVAEFIQKFKNK